MGDQEDYQRLHQEIVRDIKKARQALADVSAEAGLDMERLLDLRAFVSRLALDFKLPPTELAHVIARLAAVISFENLLKVLEQVAPDD